MPAKVGRAPTGAPAQAPGSGVTEAAEAVMRGRAPTAAGTSAAGT